MPRGRELAGFLDAGHCRTLSLEQFGSWPLGSRCCRVPALKTLCSFRPTQDRLARENLKVGGRLFATGAGPCLRVELISKCLQPLLSVRGLGGDRQRM